MDLVRKALEPLDAVDVIRLTFISATTGVLLTYLLPSLRFRFLDYGARSAEGGSKDGKTPAGQSTGWLGYALDRLAAITVPHSWFTSFYAVSVVLSIFWMVFLPLFHSRLAELDPILDLSRSSTSFAKTQLASILMLVQGVRRLVECLTLPSSSSRMWFGHWLVGIGFYVGMSVAIWVEGAPSLIRHDFSIHDLEFVAPTLRSALCLFLFLFASGIQHDCHSYLASLKRRPAAKGKYQLPDFPAFLWTLTPHYFMECLIYLSLAILTAPKGQWINETVSCAFIFVVVNLGVTAVGTRKWYEGKFGKQAIAGRWAMIPFIL